MSHLQILEPNYLLSTSVLDFNQNQPQIIFKKEGITYIRPSPQFSPYIDLYTHFTGKYLPKSLRAYPQNFTEIWIHFGDIPCFLLSEQLNQLPAMSLIGPNSTPKEYIFEGNFNSLHIAFRLGGEKPFIGYSPIDFPTTPIMLSDVFPCWKVQYLWDMTRLAPLQQVIAIEQLLAFSFQPDFSIDDRTQYGIEIVRRNWGQVEVTQLAEGLNISERQLLRSFKLETGLTTNKIIRLNRFKGTLLHLNQLYKPNFAQLALEHGYSDQPHFIREFSKFAGISPTAFLKRRETLGFLQDQWIKYTKRGQT